MPQYIEAFGQTIEFPDGMSQSAIESVLRQQASGNPAAEMSTGSLTAAGAGKSVADLFRGGKQRFNELAAGLESIVPGAQRINQLLGTKSAAQIMADDQAAITESKRLDKPLMETTPGLIGNVLGGMTAGAPLAMMGPIGAGAAFGALTPTQNGVGEVAANIGIGAAGGYLGDKAVKGVARMVSPKVDPNVQALLNEGVYPSVGQTLGGKFAAAESKATSIPLVGDMISKSHQRGTEQLNRAAMERALAPIGEKLPMNIQPGRDALSFVEKRLSDGYNSLLPKLGAQIDDTFNAELSTLRQMVNESAIDPKYVKGFDRILQNSVLAKFQGQNAMTGQTLKQVESKLSNDIARFAASNDPDARLIGDALSEVQSQLRGLITRSNPQYAKELSSLNEGWANFKRLQRAASYVGGEDGVFTAAQLQSAVKAMDRSKDKGAFARGGALMQDLSEPAKAVMGRYPDSGTAGRIANMAGLGALAGGAYVNPAIPLAGAAGIGMYTQPVQKLLVDAITRRPSFAPLLADEIRYLAPVGGLLGSTGGLLANQ